MGAQARRIQRLDYSDYGKSMVAEVGGEPDPYYHTTGPVIAILQALGCFYIITPIRGMPYGDSKEGPIFASGKGSPTYFDDVPAAQVKRGAKPKPQKKKA